MHFQEEKMENLKFYVDQNAPKTKFDHYWEKCVGACHAYTALREDYRMMLRKAKKDLENTNTISSILTISLISY